MPERPGADKPLEKELRRRLAECRDAAAMNDQVIQPFISALESVCAERGYLLNIYGETANLIFTGNAQAAEEIFRMVEEFLDDQ